MFSISANKKPGITGTLAVHTLKGEVAGIVYKNEDTGFTVFRLTDGQGVEHTASGNVEGAREGQDVELKGKWETHREYGRQFKVSEYKFTLPKTENGIIRYLSSGVIPGIGAKTAERIVAEFGTDTLMIFDQYSARLKKIPGIGRKRLKSIKEAWDEQKGRRNIDIYLQGLGISSAFCAKIYRNYGSAAPELIRENPFRLASDIKGIGFLMADNTASMLGISKNDLQRVKAGVAYALEKTEGKGHVCCPDRIFYKYASELLDIDYDSIHAGLKSACSEGQVYIEPAGISKHNMIYSKAMYKAETELPLLLDRILAAARYQGQKLNCQSSKSEQNLSGEQLEAVNTIASSPLSIITGGPGVGKTTVVGEIVRRANDAGVKVFLAAPTGRAAKRMAEATGHYAMTIHRMLKWEPLESRFYHDTKHPLKCDLLVVDEVSMLDMSLAVCLMRAVRQGTSVVFVGDSDQLPSVGPGNVLNDIICSGIAPVTHLSKIFRQGEGSGIIKSAHIVNQGMLPEFPENTGRELRDFYWIEETNPEKVLELIIKMVVERIPRRFGINPVNSIQVLTPMKRGVCGTDSINAALQKSLNPGPKPQFDSGDRIFRAGDRIIQRKNNYEKNIFNGDMGRIVRIDYSDKTFTAMFDERKVKYEITDANQVSLAYAITVHKSQGSEFPVVILPMLNQHYMLLQRKLLYTGMTRAKKLLILTGSRKAVSMAVNNAGAKLRYSLLPERLKDIKRNY